LSQLQQVTVSSGASDDVLLRGNVPLLSIVNPQRNVLPGPCFLHDLVNARSPSSIAIDFLSSDKKRVQLSYQDLIQLSGGLAMRLRSALTLCYDRNDGGTENIIVPMLVPQSPELYVSQIAILKSGAAFCPLAMDVPPERLKFILKDVGARVVVTTQDYRHRFSQADLGLDIIALVIDEDYGEQVVESSVSSFSQETVHAQRLAYVMYTSGSTGLPKGVGVSHDAVTQALLAHDEHVPQYQRFLQFAAPTFDVSVFEIFFTFHRGATLICCHREDMLNDLIGIMNKLRVDAAELTPTVAGTLLRHWDAVPCLKLLLTIGEMLPTSVIEKFAQSSDRMRVLLPMYGPTEASIHCTVAPAINNKARAGTIGQPLSTVSAFVIAEEQNGEPRILPVGHIGELAIAGQLAQGYVNRLEQTRAAFVTLPGHGIIYRTGDRARVLPSGELECKGRISSGQVKIRGQRVELGEIEQVIGNVDNIRFAIASIIDGNLIVFCSVDDETSISLCRQALQDRCRAWLPLFMRPTDYVFITGELPRLPSGKVDKQSLEKKYVNQNLRAQHDADDPVSDFEKLIAEAVREELGMDIARSEDLWSKGLDSLRSISLASKMRARSIEVSATDILTADTIVDLSETLRQRQGPHSTLVEAGNSHVNSLETLKDKLQLKLSAAELAGVEDVVLCSKLQSAMLSESVIAKHININWVKIEIAKSTSVANFVEAFCRLAKLNNILRSGFVETPDHESHFVRIIWKSFDPASQIRYEEPDHTGASAVAEGYEVPLLRPLHITVVTYQDHATVSVNIHHSLYDGWSWDLIMTDLDLLLRGENVPRRPDFQQYVQYERKFLSSADATAAQEYWADHLRDVAPTPLPVLNYENRKTETHTFCRVSEVSLSLLDDVSQRLRISRHSIPSAAFATLLKLYCGTSEIIFGSVSSGRTPPLPGIEDIIGPCISTLPVKINFDHLRTVGDLLLYADRLHRNFLHFGQLPLRDIKKAAEIASDQALFDAIFVWQESLGSKSNVESDLSVIDGIDSLQYALVLEIEPMGPRLQVKATYDTSVICHEQIKTLVNQFEAIVLFYVQDPHVPWDEVFGYFRLQDLSMANSNFSSLEAAIDISYTVDRLARDDPSRIAIEFVDDLDPITSTLKVSKLSYHDLSQKANLACQFLLSNGVSVDEIVCLYMNKSIQLYISILGVLKAGAAYIVIDPQAPLERTRRILEGSKCRCCLTSGDLQHPEALIMVESVLFYDDVAGSRQHELLRPTLDGANLAYAVFTSGSTGTPKGVLITRNNILSNIAVLSHIYPSVANGALLQACSPAFDGEFHRYGERTSSDVPSFRLRNTLYMAHGNETLRCSQ
jgi:ferricrocin synthase